MLARAFIVVAALAVITTALVHVFSYIEAVPHSWLAVAMTSAIALFASLIGVGVWKVRGRKLPEALNGYYRVVMLESPKSLRFLFFLAWLAAVFAIVESAVTGVSRVMQFHTAWCFAVSTMALCFAIGLRRVGAKDA